MRLATNAVSNITSVRHLRAIAGGLVLTALLANCDPPVNQVRIEPGTAPRTPVFVLTDSTGSGPAGAIYGLSVVPCGADAVVWQIVATGTNGPPTLLTYGVTPPGYVSHLGPAPLSAGCYDVFVTDGRRARFRVDAAGKVTTEARRDSVKR